MNFKICFIAHSLAFKDGWGRYSWDLVNALREKNISCRVLLPKNSEVEKIGDIEVLKVLRPLENGQIKLKNIFRDFLEVIKQAKDCDCVHTLVEPYSILSVLSAKFLRKPYFITIHGTFSFLFLGKGIKAFFFRLAIKKARKVFCVSRFTENVLKKKILGLSSCVIHNGINLEKFRLRGQQCHKADGNPVILSVGVLRLRKGYHISIPAMAGIKIKYPGFKYYIVGNQSNSDYLNALKALVNEHGLGNNIVFWENLADEYLNCLYSQADLFILTPVNDRNAFEGFGLVYLEAGAFSKPVIGSSGCGVEDAIEDGYNGFLVPQGDIEAVSGAVLKILGNPKMAQTLGSNGRKRAEEHSWDKIAEQYINAYDFKT